MMNAQQIHENGMSSNVPVRGIATALGRELSLGGFMGSFMKRVCFVAGALVLATSAIAADDPIAARQALMKATGKQAGAGAAMIRGEAPFDLDKAKAIFTAFQDTSAKAPALFPDNSKTGADTAALPKIWESKSDFEARFAKLGADAKAAGGSVSDLDSFKTAFAGIGKDCGGCHETYRLKK